MKIKTTRIVNFKELMGLYANSELPIGSYESIDYNECYLYRLNVYNTNVVFKKKDLKTGMEHGHTIIPNHIKFKVTTEKEITEDMVLDEFVCLLQYDDTVFTKTFIGMSINDCIDNYGISVITDLLSISIIQDNELITIWKDGELIK